MGNPKGENENRGGEGDGGFVSAFAPVVGFG
jgi:hypothetical protein